MYVSYVTRFKYNRFLDICWTHELNFIGLDIRTLSRIDQLWKYMYKLYIVV